MIVYSLDPDLRFPVVFRHIRLCSLRQMFQLPSVCRFPSVSANVRTVRCREVEMTDARNSIFGDE